MKRRVGGEAAQEDKVDELLELEEGLGPHRDRNPVEEREREREDDQERDRDSEQEEEDHRDGHADDKPALLRLEGGGDEPPELVRRDGGGGHDREEKGDLALGEGRLPGRQDGGG